jgi:hypothetical protein
MMNFKQIIILQIIAMAFLFSIMDAVIRGQLNAINRQLASKAWETQRTSMERIDAVENDIIDLNDKMIEVIRNINDNRRH